VIDVLRGVETERIKPVAPRLQLSVYGIGADRSEQEWRAILRQVIALGLVHGRPRCLQLAEADRRRAPGAEGRAKVQLRQYQKPVKPKRAGREARQRATSRLDLSPPSRRSSRSCAGGAWRRRGRTACRPTSSSSDATLREIAKVKPTSLDDLRGVSGVGEKKLVLLRRRDRRA
jgi:ATP-dependent DNA helicase RecQ